MIHIRQINSVGTNSYTVVDLTGYVGELENHPTIVNNPDLFEISDSDIPEQHQYVNPSCGEIPQEVQLWRIRTVLKLMQLETPIEQALETLPEPSKTAANYIWNYGTTVERSSQTVLLLQSVLQMTNEEVDNLFIQSEAILL